jgi:hypothetical protein
MSDFISLMDFADREGFTLRQAYSLARRGLILGATQDLQNRCWRIYSPATLSSKPRNYKRRQGGQLNEARQDARRPRTPPEIRVICPFSVDQIPSIYRDTLGLHACHCPYAEGGAK